MLLSDMAHRGPDDQGTWLSDSAILGHRRLEILDLTQCSRQPATCADQTHVLLYNGEIYNHETLTPAPCASDTLALCALLPALDPAQLRGMFSIAVWDIADEKLELHRDRFGIKPLYYSTLGSRFAFASYACSTASAAGASVLDGHALSSYLRFGSVLGPSTMFKDVEEVEPGTTLVWRDDAVASTRYWEFPSRPTRTTRSDVEESLRSSVRAHVLSDVPVAVFLSAGIDSTLITALASDLGLDVTALTIGFPGHPIDEAREAAHTAAQLGVPHQIVDIDEGDIDFDHFFQSMDQPSIDGLNTYLVAQAAKEAGFRVALTGLGADEIFAGYNLFRRLPMIALAAQVLPRGLTRKVLRKLANPAKADEAVAAGSDLPQLHEVMRSLWSSADVHAFTGRATSPVPISETARGLVNRLCCLELQRYTQNTLLRDADVYGMAHSVEIRTPFLDHVVLETALGYSQWARALPTKRLLKRMLAGRGLDQLLKRKKSGFVLPYADWLNGPLAHRVAQLSDGPLADVLGGPGTKQVLESPHSANTMQLWSLVVLDAWLRREQVARGPLVVSD